MAKLMAEALSGMNIDRAFIVHGLNGWDEPTPVGKFELYDVKPNRVQHTVRDPKDFGIDRCTEDDLKGGDAKINSAALINVFNQNDQGPHKDALVLGTGLALEVSSTVNNLKEGIELARSTIDDGKATQMINSLSTDD